MSTRARVLIAAGLMVGALVPVGLLTARGPRTLPSASVPAANPSPAPSSPESPDLAFTGVILPQEAADVSARAEGVIAAVHVALGSTVRRGALLAVIDTMSPGRADVAMAEAELSAAISDVRRVTLESEQATQRRARADALKTQQLISAEQWEDAAHQERLAEARVASAESLVEQKRALVQHRTAVMDHAGIRAPFDGTVATQYLDRGARVSPGTPVLRVLRPMPLRVRFAVPGTHAPTLRKGVRIVASLDEGLSLTGRVDAVGVEVDSASQMVVVEATLDAPPPATEVHYLIGRSVRVTIAGDQPPTGHAP